MDKGFFLLLLLCADKLSAQYLSDVHMLQAKGGVTFSSINFNGNKYDFWFYCNADTILIDGDKVLTVGNKSTFYNAYSFYTDTEFNKFNELHYWNNGQSPNSNGGIIYTNSKEYRSDGTSLLTFTGRDSLYLNGDFLNVGLEDQGKTYMGLTKLGSDNEILYQRFYASGLGYTKTATLPDGRIVLVGMCDAQMVTLDDFVLEPGPDLPCGTTHDTDIIIALLDGATGAVLNARRFGGCYWDYIEGLAVTPDSRIILAGAYSSDDFQFDDLFLTNPYGLWASNGYLMALDTNLQLQWYKNLNAKHQEYSTKVLTDSVGNIYWSVRLSGAYAKLDNDTIWGQKSSVLLFKFSPEGQLIFQNTLNSNAGVWDYDSKLDQSGNFWYSLLFQDTLTFGDQRLIGSGTESTALVLRINSDGSYGPYYATDAADIRQFRHISPIDAERLCVMCYISNDKPFQFLNINYTPPPEWSILEYYLMGIVHLPATPVSDIPATNTTALQVWPSPAGATSIQVRLSSQAPVRAQLRVFQMQGRLVYELPWALQPGEQQQEIPVSNWAPGLYRVVVDMGKQGVRIGSFVKE